MLLINNVIGGIIRWSGLGFFIRPPSVFIPNSPELVLFAIAVLVCAWVKRRLAWSALFKGYGWNTYSTGKSYLCFVLPWLRPDFVNRVIEPLLFGFAGWRLCASGETILGGWLLLSAFAVWWHEQRFLEYVLASQFARHNAQTLEVMQQELVAGIATSMRRRGEFGRNLANSCKSLGPVIEAVVVSLPARSTQAREQLMRWVDNLR